MSARQTAQRCPCGENATLENCCGRYHVGQVALTADALMRSRYSAYVLGLNDYLLASWHPSTRPTPAALANAGNTRWLGLEVRRHEQADADHAVVEFVARYRVGGGPAVRLHEISRFVREDGRWFYLDAKP